MPHTTISELNISELTLLKKLLGAALTGQTVASLIPDSTPEPEIVSGESIWTADNVVRWVDKGAGARNDVGARIPDGAQDPLGLLRVAAQYPGRPVFPEGFRFKTGKQLPADAVIVRAGKQTRAGRTERTIVDVDAPAPRTAPRTAHARTRNPVTGTPTMEDTVGAWALNPVVKEVMAEFKEIAEYFVGREYTYRDVLAAAGGAPPRQK